MAGVSTGAAYVRSVNVGTPLEASWAVIGATAIDKQPAAARVRVGELGLEGDQVADTRHHGGVDQAVYAFAREDLDHWAGVLGEEIRDGQFGENLTTVGIDVNEAEVGERWRVGGPEGPVLEVASIRTPCADFKSWMGRSGYDDRAWVKRFAAEARPGPYLRVVVPGEVGAGDELEVVHRPGHGVTVSMMFRALHGHPDLLPRLLEVERLASKARVKVEEYVAATANATLGTTAGESATGA